MLLPSLNGLMTNASVYTSYYTHYLHNMHDVVSLLSVAMVRSDGNKVESDVSNPGEVNLFLRATGDPLSHC